ncbi:hypothetical protein ACIRP3_12845 [Streptomyces sp. NPDC101209]|uniref:hypothetical protein n=1 Tax=Streptomyces sp. NPDC101209 TaxID=3366129 RepID=UPI0038011B22
MHFQNRVGHPRSPSTATSTSTSPRSRATCGAYDLIASLTGDAVRGSLEGHFAIEPAFQNCHRVGAYRPGPRTAGGTYDRFTSPRSQVLNRSPEFRDC